MLHPRIHALLAALLAASLLLPCAGCGGGGGGGGGGVPSEGNPPPSVSPTVLTQDLMTECGGKLSIDEIRDIVDLYEQVTSGAGEIAGFRILVGQAVNDPGLILPWELDTDGDGVLEAMGEFAVQDSGGAPASPFTPQQLLPVFTTGIAGLASLFPLMPDGHQFVFSVFDMPGDPGVNGEVRATFATGQPALASGNLAVTRSLCSAQITWTNVPINALGASFPTAAFSLRVTKGSDVLDGTLTTDGTSTATAELSLNAGSTTHWEIDLVTGTVTQVLP